MIAAGYLQFAPRRGDVAANLRAVRSILDRSPQPSGPWLLVLPELANSGYLYPSPGSLDPFAEPADGRGPFLAGLRDLISGTEGCIVTGYAERAPEGPYNAAAALTSSGVVANYRKTHLFAGEKTLFLPGDTGFGVFEHHGVRIGMMVCFDWFFPEAARTLALRGAQIIAHPANLVLPYCQTAMVTRCLENRVFAITANRYGEEALDGLSLTFTGASQVMGPQGKRLARAGAAGDRVGFVRIDPALAADKNVTSHNDLFADRRPEMYA
jgi:predicted amidohydrolase